MKTIIICFGCRRRVTAEEIRAGFHNHADGEQPMLAAPSQAK